MKEDSSPAKISEMISQLQSLRSIDGILHLVVGEAISRPGLEKPEWSHSLYGRYVSKEALHAYAISDKHVDVVQNFVLPNITGLMAVDWEAEVTEQPGGGDIGAIHSVVFQTKEEATPEEVLGTINSLVTHSSSIPGVIQATSGPNFTPERSEGHNWGFISIHSNLEALESYGKNEEHWTIMKEKVFPLVQKSASVDYEVIPISSKI